MFFFLIWLQVAAAAEAAWAEIIPGSFSTRCQFHQRFTYKFFVRKCFAQFFSGYVLALAKGRKHFHMKIACVKCWWNWPQSSNFEETLEADLVDFLTHLFWVLELRRRDFLKERPESRLPFLCAPFEKKDFVGLDLESRTNRKRTFGRHRKHVADLCLLCDCLTEAQQYYDVAVDILR